jgi:hypothetical protein
MTRERRQLLAHVLLVPTTAFAILGMEAVFLKLPGTYFKSPLTIALAMAVGVISQVGAAWMIREVNSKKVG